MFYDSSFDIEELWDVLIRISAGPAKDIAKETLENLIKNSTDQFDIIRYNHLLYKIQEYNYLY